MTQRGNSRKSQQRFVWLKGHADKKPSDSIEVLIQQQLSTDKIYNVWCGKMAQHTWELGPTLNLTPKHPHKWAVYSISKMSQDHR